jgi:hypothetical protein
MMNTNLYFVSRKANQEPATKQNHNTGSQFGTCSNTFSFVQSFKTVRRFDAKLSAVLSESVFLFINLFIRINIVFTTNCLPVWRTGDKQYERV